MLNFWPKSQAEGEATELPIKKCVLGNLLDSMRHQYGCPLELICQQVLIQSLRLPVLLYSSTEAQATSRGPMIFNWTFKRSSSLLSTSAFRVVLKFDDMIDHCPPRVFLHSVRRTGPAPPEDLFRSASDTTFISWKTRLFLCRRSRFPVSSPSSSFLLGDPRV